MLDFRLSTDVFGMFEFGRTYTFRIYNEDNSVYDASASGPDGALTPIIKVLKRPGDQALFFRDVAKAIEVIRNVAQIVADITGSWSTQNQGIGTFAFTETKRIGVGGRAWIQIVLVDDVSNPTKAIPTRLLPISVHPSVALQG